MDVNASTPLWIACRTLLAEHADKFFLRWDDAAESFEEEDIHDFRVASRRLREALALFSPCLAAGKRKSATRQVKGVTVMLGTMRNTDEAFRFFADLSPEEKSGSAQELDELLTTLRREREEVHHQLRDDLAALAQGPLRKKLQDLRDRPNLFAESAVDPFVAFSFYAGGAIMDRGEPLGELVGLAREEANGAAQHRLRIAIKKLRYRVEIIEPLIRKSYDELRGILKGYQDVLGKLHDIDVFREMVLERVAAGPGREALLSVLAQRRVGLHREFMEMLEQDPIQKMSVRVKTSL
jgi:CHAD domain-containing protein